MGKLFQTIDQSGRGYHGKISFSSLRETYLEQVENGDREEEEDEDGFEDTLLTWAEQADEGDEYDDDYDATKYICIEG